MTNEQIAHLVGLSHYDLNDINRVYHCTDMDTVPCIVKDDAVYLRMKHIDNFEDRYEGKTVEIYYDLALERLYKEKCISLEIYEQLNNIQVPSKLLFVFNTADNESEGRAIEADCFVVCFSKTRSPYMMEHYVKNAQKKGYCIEFLWSNLKNNKTTQTFGKGVRFLPQKVVYGSDAVQELYDFLKELISIPDTFDMDFLKTWGTGIIQEKLSYLQCRTKLFKYHQEDEVRLVLAIPRGNYPDGYVLPYTIQEQNKTKFVDIPFHKSVYWNLFKSDAVTDEEHASIQKTLKDRNYSISEG